jgi:hypothetical protein
MRRVLAFGALLALVAAVGGGCGSRSASTQCARQAPVVELRSIDQLRSIFNAHPGVPRLILLISPT